MRPSSAGSAVADEASRVPWYHSLELPGGVVTRGLYDLRRVRRRVPLPPLDGRRCLDVGSSSGYWAFEMEKLGAAEVVSLDLEDPSRQDWAAPTEPDWDSRRPPEDLIDHEGQVREEWVDGKQVGGARGSFEVARRHLGSRVERVDGSVYDLDPGWVGEFEFVFMGNLLLHLRDPVGAVAAVRRVCRGELLSFDVVSPLLSLLGAGSAVAAMWRLELQQWWLPSPAAHRRWIEAAGFEVLGHGGPLFQSFGRSLPRPPLRRVRSRRDLYFAIAYRVGIPTQWVLARPNNASRPSQPG
jgi:tRNA (mo5U34)-methyltransferase